MSSRAGRTAPFRECTRGSAHKLHGFDHLPGTSGLWVNFRVTLRSFDTEQQLFSVFVRTAGVEARDFSARMIYYPLSEHEAPVPILERFRGPLTQALCQQVDDKLELLRQLDQKVFEEEAAKIDTYFEDALMEFEDREQALLRQMERVHAKRQKARAFEERKALRHEYETLKEEYFKMQRDNFQRRQARNSEREDKIQRLGKQMEAEVRVDCISAAYVEIV